MTIKVNLGTFPCKSGSPAVLAQLLAHSGGTTICPETAALGGSCGSWLGLSRRHGPSVRFTALLASWERSQSHWGVWTEAGELLSLLGWLVCSFGLCVPGTRQGVGGDGGGEWVVMGPLSVCSLPVCTPCLHSLPNTLAAQSAGGLWDYFLGLFSLLLSGLCFSPPSTPWEFLEVLYLQCLIGSAH